MRTGILILAIAVFVSTCPAEEARILRYPHYHEGTLVFSYMGDLWTVRDDGSELKRLTVHEGRDLVPQFHGYSLDRGKSSRPAANHGSTGHCGKCPGH